MIVYRQILEDGGYIEHERLDTMPQDANYIEVDKTPTPEEIAEANKLIVPQTISAMRLKLQLFDMGITDEDIFEDIDSIPEVMFSTADKEKAKIMYKTATSFERTDGKLNLVATMEGLSQEQVDEIFINGNL